MAEGTEGAFPIFIDVGEQLQGPNGQVSAEPDHVVKLESGSGLPEGIPVPPDRIRCPECRFTVTCKDKLLRHIRKVHRGQDPFPCTLCDYSTYNKAVFEEHIRVHQGIKPFQCTFCPYKSASKKNTKKHELIHRPNNPLRCGDCPFIARHFRGLYKHQRTHSDPSNPTDPPNPTDPTNPSVKTCTKCKLTFKKMSQFSKHKKRCDKCNRRICAKAFERHVLRHESLVSVVRKNTFQCRLCAWGGASRLRILLHLIHHPRQQIPDSLDVDVLRACGIPVGESKMG